MERQVCPVCGRRVDEDVWEYHRVLEDRVLDIIKEHNPTWVLSDGSSPKAVEYYLAMVVPGPAPGGVARGGRGERVP